MTEPTYRPGWYDNDEGGLLRVNPRGTTGQYRRRPGDATSRIDSFRGYLARDLDAGTWRWLSSKRPRDL